MKIAICGALCLILVLSALFFPEQSQSRGEAVSKRIVRVWNVDTFEGGKGSRTSFLKDAAKRVEKKREGVYYLISSYTPEGAEEAFCEGKFPDAISFGVGLSAFAERSVKLPFSFIGGQIGSDTLAYPWCKGGYYLFSLTDQFEEEGNTAISAGGRNLSAVAAALEGIRGEELPALTAYSEFISGKYRYLLGTQRDVCRFETRGVNVFSKPIESYCDLYQYFSVLNEGVKEDSLALLRELIDAPEKLSSIGMSPFEAESCAKTTVGVFSSADALAKILGYARNGDEKNLRNFLKTV